MRIGREDSMVILISQDKLNKLSSYFHKTEAYSTSPSILALIVDQKEWSDLVTYERLFEKEARKHGLRPPRRKSLHDVPTWKDMKRLKAALFHKDEHPHFWLPTSPLSTLSKSCGENIDDYDYVIIIRYSATFMHPLCKKACLCFPFDCPNMLMYLTHEYVHVVEKETNRKIMPESPSDSYSFTEQLMEEIFKGEVIKAINFHRKLK